MAIIMMEKMRRIYTYVCFPSKPATWLSNQLNCFATSLINYHDDDEDFLWNDYHDDAYLGNDYYYDDYEYHANDYHDDYDDDQLGNDYHDDNDDYSANDYQ